MMKHVMFCENHTSASASYAEAPSACAANACENTVMLIMDAVMLMASIILFVLVRLSISLLVLVIISLLGILIIKEKVNRPDVWIH